MESTHAPIQVFRSNIEKARELIRLAQLKEVMLGIDRLVESFPALKMIGNLRPGIFLPSPEEIRRPIKHTTDRIYEVGLPQTLVFAVSCLETFFKDQYKMLSKKEEEGRWFQNIEKVRNNFGKYVSGDILDGKDDLFKETNEIFERRHVIVHKAGFIDKDYCEKTQRPPALIGSRLQLTADVLMKHIDVLEEVAETVYRNSQLRLES